MSALTGFIVRRKWVLGATVLVLLGGATVGIIANGHTSPTSASPSVTEGSNPTETPPPSPLVARSLTSEQQSEVQQNISRIRAVAPISAATSRQYPAVGAEAGQQPDLYAAAFARQLLTQDYRISRDQLLAWVQSESAQSTEPLVVGLTPVDLRTSMAVASVQEGVNGLAPVPTATNWADLAQRQRHTTVQIQRVTEPVSWARAVANGRVTDPGVTARQVDAEVTLHTTDRGRVTTKRFSVALVINLEGPPVRDGYGFVTAITYNTAVVGSP